MRSQLAHCIYGDRQLRTLGLCKGVERDNSERLVYAKGWGDTTQNARFMHRGKSCEQYFLDEYDYGMEFAWEKV
jgi:hypothetical protein